MACSAAGKTHVSATWEQIEDAVCLKNKGNIDGLHTSSFCHSSDLVPMMVGIPCCSNADWLLPGFHTESLIAENSQSLEL